MEHPFARVIRDHVHGHHAGRHQLHDIGAPRDGWASQRYRLAVPMGRVIVDIIFDVELLGFKEASAQNDKRETVASSEGRRRSATPRPTATR